jgi:type 2 lantibiotic biosynthesis protein LanM
LKLTKAFNLQSIINDPFFLSLKSEASTFEEILSDEYSKLPGQKENADKAALRLSAWCRSAASGDWTLFSKRLKRDHLCIEDVLARFSTVEATSNCSPDWIIDSKWIMDCLETCCSLEFEEQWKKESFKKLPFETLFLKIIEVAGQKVIVRLEFDHTYYFSKSGWLSIELLLLSQISSLFEAVLFDLFTKFSTAEKSAHSTKIIDPLDDDQYARFILNLQKQGIRNLFKEKPVLIRLLANVTRHWIEATVLLLERIHADFTEITQSFKSNAEYFSITRVIGGLSDHHNFGEAVLILVINDVYKIVYKPKDLSLDNEWGKLCEKLNSNNSPVKLQAVKIILRDGYGWTEFIPHDACTSEDEFAIFFKRAGSWLALFHLYAGADMHFENIIACGSNPVPIDLEMLLQGTSPENELSSPELSALNEANHKIANSVLSVGMLPAYTRLANNKIVDLGGLNGVPQSFSVNIWDNINKNGMCWSKIIKTDETFLNIPHSNGVYAQLDDHLIDFINGFKTYSNFLLEIKQKKGSAFFFDNFKGLKVRKLIRPTRFYALLMERLKDHRTMSDGVTWSVQADFIARLADWNSSHDIIWPLQKSERDALLCLNIPHFTTLSDGGQINDFRGTLIASPALNGLSRALTRFENLNQEEIAWQTKVIELSTFTTSTALDKYSSEKYKFDRIMPSTKKNTQPMVEYKKCVDSMLDVINKAALKKDNSVAWLSLNWLGDSEAAQLMPMGPDLYSGTLGIALFFAGHYQYSGSKSSQLMSYKVIDTIRYSITQNTAARWARNLGIGGATGLGSIVYGLATMSQLLNDPKILGDAELAVGLFTADLIAADEALDVIAGSAGAILCLLKLHKLSGSSLALDKAILCGNHLLKMPRYGQKGARSWTFSKNSQTPLGGMSHGASGFALAMFSLFELTKRDDFLEAGKECLNYEKSTFSPKNNNWADLRVEKQFLCQWCHGAVGIGLSRLSILKIWDGYREEIQEDIQNSIKIAEKNWPNRTDTLCCGTLGSIEFLRETSRVLNKPELADLSSHRLLEIILSSKEKGKYSIFTKDLEFSLGLFQGAAGIGYTALRQVNDKLPNILLWQ